jgi:raffinose synthase
MFHFIEDKEKVLLVSAENSILQGLDMVARLHDGREVTLHAQQIDRNKVIFRDEDEMIEAYLNLEVEGVNAAFYINAAIHNKELFRDRVSFAPLNGIVIRVRDIPGISGLMANYQHKDWWTRPFFQTDLSQLPARTLSLLWKANDLYTHLLPVCDKEYRTDLCGSTEGMHIRISAYQGGFAECSTLAFVLASGQNPFQLAELNAQVGLKASGGVARPRTEKTYPEILDHLGWCSWDAFYQEVNAEGLLEKSKEFKTKNIPVRWVMIDDGWSEVSDDKRLRSYDAVPDKFPGGLSAVIKEMKQEYGVNWVGVWHTIAGYWGGVDPDGELFESNKGYLYQNNGGAWVPRPDSVSGFGFWNDWHAYLKRQGVDFVKVDSQSAVANFLTDHTPIGVAAQSAHTALEASVGLHFNGCVINCMGMASENIWHRPASAVSRNSDDFMPENKDSFKEHALQNAYNSFYHGHFYWGDWDMYWTDNPDDQQNMVLRAISGGPIYFSDKPAQTNPNHIWPLVYRDGKIIRCDQPGQPTEDGLTVNPIVEAVPLKIWNRIGKTGVIAAFNIHQEAEVKGDFSPSDIPGMEGTDFWVYEYVQKKLFSLKLDERSELELQQNETVMYSIIPKEAEVTPIGLIDKIISTDAVNGCWHGANKTIIHLKEGGKFAFTSANNPVSIMINGTKAEYIQGEHEELYIIDCQHIEATVNIEICF